MQRLILFALITVCSTVIAGLSVASRTIFLIPFLELLIVGLAGYGFITEILEGKDS